MKGRAFASERDMSNAIEIVEEELLFSPAHIRTTGRIESPHRNLMERGLLLVLQDDAPTNSVSWTLER
jgi:hypothetical protein